MKYSKKFIPLLIFFFLFGFALSGHGQSMQPQEIDTITNQELKKVAATLQEAKVIQQNANKKLRDLVKKEDLTLNRFRMIMISRQNPKMADSLNITEEEEVAFKRIQPELAKINRQSKQKFNQVIKEHGLTQQRLQQIMLVLRTKPEVAQRFQKIVTDTSKQ